MSGLLAFIGWQIVYHQRNLMGTGDPVTSSFPGYATELIIPRSKRKKIRNAAAKR